MFGYHQYHKHANSHDGQLSLSTPPPFVRRFIYAPSTVVLFILCQHYQVARSGDRHDIHESVSGVPIHHQLNCAGRCYEDRIVSKPPSSNTFSVLQAEGYMTGAPGSDTCRKTASYFQISEVGLRDSPSNIRQLNRPRFNAILRH